MKINLKQARETLNLTQTKMAKAMGVARGTWLKWEREEQGITAGPYRLLRVLLWLNYVGMFDIYLRKFSGGNKK